MTAVLAAGDHDECSVAIAALRHEVLRAVDRAVGAEAQVDNLRALVASQQSELDRGVAQIRKLTVERDRLRKQISAMYASTTWRTGRMLVAPTARLSRRLRRGRA